MDIIQYVTYFLEQNNYLIKRITDSENLINNKNNAEVECKNRKQPVHLIKIITCRLEKYKLKKNHILESFPVDFPVILFKITLTPKL